MRLHLLLVVCVLVGCSGKDIPTTVDVSSLPITVDLRVGQTVRLTTEGIAVRFDSVISDSRCPLGLECFWEGDAGARFTIVVAASSPTACTLHTKLDPKFFFIVDSLSVKLKRLAPYPKVGSQIDPREYVVTIELARDTIPGWLPVSPTVRITPQDFSESEIRARAPDTVLLKTFVGAYKGSWSPELKQRILSSLQSAVNAMGLSVDGFLKTFSATGQSSSDVLSLPYLAEKTQYEGKESWMYEFVWGGTPDDLGHFRCFVMDASSADTLLFITCR